MLGWISEEPGSILSAVSSMRFFKKGDGLSEMVALLESSTWQSRKRPTVMKGHFSESACGRGASIIMHFSSNVLGRVHQAAHRPAIKLNTCTQRKGCQQIVWHFILRGTDNLQRTQMHTPAQEVSLTCLPTQSCSASLQTKIITRRPSSVPNWHRWTCLANGDEILTC